MNRALWQTHDHHVPPIVRLGGVAITVLLAVTACGSSDTDRSQSGASAAGSLPFGHVHGVAVDPGDRKTVIATHDGLYELGDYATATRVGPTIDLMGFAVAGPGHYLASGHPGSGVDLPQPVGLIESTDGGETWTPLSRRGESDFHALAVSASGVLGFDGALVRSGDGREWQELEIPAAPAALAVSPDGHQVLATTAKGLLRSEDEGASWSLVDGAPVLQLVGWGDEHRAVGIRPDGTVFTSADGGSTWQEGTSLGAAPQALYVGAEEGVTRVIAVTTDAVLESRDGGQSFDSLVEL